MAALQSAGLRFGTDGTVRSLWQYLRSVHGFVAPTTARLGDVVLFRVAPSDPTDLTACDAPDRVGIVSGVDPNLSEADRTWATTGGSPSLAWYNLAAFAPNTPGVWGNTPKGYLVGPGFWNVDASFSRNLNFSGGKRIELRVEAFNLFNHSNWANPTVQIGSTALTNGRATNTIGDPRIMQFAVKYSF